MPLETGEKRHDSDDDDPENIDGDHEDSRDRTHAEAEPTVESSLREFEETLNKHQHDSEEGLDQAALTGTKRGEPTGEPSLDHVDEEYPQETAAAANEENRESSLLEWSLGEYEATMTPPTSGSEATSETGEHGAPIAEHDQLSDSESENQRSGNIQAQGAEVAGTESVEAGERVDTETQQNWSSELAQNINESQAEHQQLGSHGESEVSEQQGESPDRSHEYVPLRLSDDPEAFAGKNSEQLVELGILPEQDEVKLDGNTALRFDVSEGLTMIHGDQRYEITTVEQERIGELDFFSFKTEQGEEFLHIPGQDKVVPPYETTWYALPSNTEVYLDREYKHELLEAAIDKAGGETALRHELGQHGTQMSDTFAYKHLHDLRDGMSEDKLIPILDYLGRDLDETNSYINAIGHCRAIEDPNLPFDLNNEDGARIMAARFSDGTNCAPEGRGPRFDYANKDPECRNRVEESLAEVFGGANITNKEYDTGDVAKVRTSTDVIGHTMERAGAVTGEIIEQNPHIPTFILEGSTEMQHEWLTQAYADEGYTWPQRGKVCIGRAAEVTEFLSQDMMDRLRPETWEERRIGDQLVTQAMSCDDLPLDIHNAIESHPPNILTEERGMLETLGIHTQIYPQEIYQRNGGEGYGVNWVLQTETREDSKHFLEEIGFPQQRKQEGLISALRLRE